MRLKTSRMALLLPIMFSKLDSSWKVLLEEDVLFAQPAAFEPVGDEDLELLDVEGLDDIVEGARSWSASTACLTLP